MKWVEPLFLEQEGKLMRDHLDSYFEKKGGPFKNPFISSSKRTPLGALLWLTGYYKDPARFISIPKGFTYPNFHYPIEEHQPKVSWINHSTFLVEVWGVRFLTDPIWADRCSPFTRLGPKRLFNNPIEIQDIGNIDFVLISHNHYDHLDIRSVSEINTHFPDAQWLVPLGVKRWLKKLGTRHVLEMGWWQKVNWVSHYGEGVKVGAQSVPAQHFSGRYGWDRNRSLWCGWCLRLEQKGKVKQVYFAGDTGYNQYDFNEIYKRCGAMDLSLIPIGAYMPRDFMRSVHVNPSEAVQMHLDVHSKLSIAGHWGTFRLSSEGRKRPPFDLFLAMQSRGLPFEQFRVLNPGQTINWL